MTQQIKLEQVYNLGGGVDGQLVRRQSGDAIWSNESTKTWASGTAVARIFDLNASSAAWRNITIFYKLEGLPLLATPSSFALRLKFAAGSPEIGAMKILRTLQGSTSVLDSTTVTIGGVSNPTLTTPTNVVTDSIAVALDREHDYSFAIYFSDVAANTSVSVGRRSGAGTNLAVFQTGNQTGVTTLPAMAGDLYLIAGPVIP
jgi:hypothetical protein